MITISASEEKELRRTFSALIADVERLFDESRIHLGGGPETTALGNLVGVAQTASCLKEVELFIQYQTARDTKKWEEGHHFGTTLVKRFSDSGVVAQQAQRAISQLKESRTSGEEELRTWLAVQYLGFVRRKYLFLSKLGKEKNP
jgi:hypothetical protein